MRYVALLLLLCRAAHSFALAFGNRSWTMSNPWLKCRGHFDGNHRDCSPRRCRLSKRVADDAFSGTERFFIRPNLQINAARRMTATLALVASLTLAGLWFPPSIQAYEPSDYASDTVKNVIQQLQDSRGNPDQTFDVYESIADIIVEGKGVGGSINFQGVQLDRGYVADEDTSIYNPGLTLLTESEKTRLVDALVSSRRASLEQNAGANWNEKNEVAFSFLREKLDPYHMYELHGYLGVAPVVIGATYMATLAVQQVARGFFPVAYIAGVVVIVAPALALIALGP